MENIVVTRFEVESEAYQAYSDVKGDAYNMSCKVLEGSLIKREHGNFRVVEDFDSGQFCDDTITGGFVGALIGILGGPIGVLLGGGLGLVGGSAVDIHDRGRSTSMIERVLDDVGEGDCMLLIMFAQEDGTKVLDYKLGKYRQTTMRYDAAEILEEVKAASELQKEMERKARSKLRDSKSEERKVRVEQNRQKIRDFFNRSDKG